MAQSRPGKPARRASATAGAVEVAFSWVAPPEPQSMVGIRTPLLRRTVDGGVGGVGGVGDVGGAVAAGGARGGDGGRRGAAGGGSITHRLLSHTRKVEQRFECVQHGAAAPHAFPAPTQPAGEGGSAGGSQVKHLLCGTLGPQRLPGGGGAPLGHRGSVVQLLVVLAWGGFEWQQGDLSSGRHCCPFDWHAELSVRERRRARAGAMWRMVRRGIRDAEKSGKRR